jgi:chaperonin GroES
MNVKPIGGRILVRRIEEDVVSGGGIVIPDTAKEKPHRGEIMALGSGKRNEKGDEIPFEVKKGDHVLFGKYSGTEITIDGVEYLFLNEDDILAVF